MKWIYTTIDMVSMLLKNPSLKFKRYNDEVFKIYLNARGYIMQSVNGFSMEFPIGLYTGELWLLDSNDNYNNPIDLEGV